MKPPQLVLDDPWLEPHQDVIKARMMRWEKEVDWIKSSGQTLVTYASAHEDLGIHLDEKTQQWWVREWAPGAKAVSLIGDFNGWDRQSSPLQKREDGVWSLALARGVLAHGARVKLHVIGADGVGRDRIPAMIQRAVQDPETFDYSGQVWAPEVDYHWKHDFDPRTVGSPLIYESHVGMAGEEPRVHTYREFADLVLPRIHRAGYNVVQLMAVQEHPYYASFGYHVSSFFAPCSRFGSPDDLKYLIDEAHGLGMAVLLDVVHSHAIKNTAEGLNGMDGTDHQYFHSGERGDHVQWGSKCFDYGRPEVRRFLLSNVRFWLEEYRFDGFRFDGVTSMLYHSHGNKVFGSYEDYYGVDVDEDALLYLQLATALISEIKPGALMIAEDMSGMPGLARSIQDGGLGFTHRLAMGIPDFWIKLLKHSRDEDWDLNQIWSVLTNRRRGEATIAYAESHDQALVGDKTLAFWLMDEAMYWHMGKDDGDATVDRGVALHKWIRLVTLVLGGEGWLNFMGNEFGHPEWLDFPREGNEWSFHYCRRQWSLADRLDLKYQYLAEFDRSLMCFAKSSGLLASDPAQVWVMDHDKQVMVVERLNYIFVFNLSVDRSYVSYPIKVPDDRKRILILDTDTLAHGGHGRVDPTCVYPVDAEDMMHVYLPARTGLVFKALEA